MLTETRATTANGHRADLADRQLLDDLAAACAWWARQRAWRVSSSHTGGGVIAALEHAVTREIGPSSHALALPSGTAALATALHALHLTPGSAIGVPALDWTATAAVAKTLGLHTVPLPVNPKTGLLDVELLHREPHLLDGLSAVVAVHLHGLTCDVPTLCQARPDLPIVEDAAQAWAARYPSGAPIGSAADACVFSFGATKNPSAGELGCLVHPTSAAQHRAAVLLTQHPTRQLLAGITNPRDDQPMARVAPAAALLGAYALHRHHARIPALKQAATTAAMYLRDAGLAVPTAPDLNAPGVIAVQAAPDVTWAALTRFILNPGITVASLDRADLRVHPDAKHQDLLHVIAAAFTVITLTAQDDAHERADEARPQ